MTIERAKKYALLLACKDSDYALKKHSGYLNVFIEPFSGTKETPETCPGWWRATSRPWRTCASTADSPGVEAHMTFTAMICGILRLCFLLQTLNAMQKRVLGICFGHQETKELRGWSIDKMLSFHVADAVHSFSLFFFFFFFFSCRYCVEHLVGRWGRLVEGGTLGPGRWTWRTGWELPSSWGDCKWFPSRFRSSNATKTRYCNW